MHIASREENQQFAAIAVAAAANVFGHFRTYYKLNIVSIYIWMDSRLNGLSIESKNTQNGVRTKKLCASEVGRLSWCRGYAVAWNPTQRRARSGTQPRYGVDSTQRRARGDTQPRYGVDSTQRRARGALAAPIHARFRPETIPEQPLSTGDNILPI